MRILFELDKKDYTQGGQQDLDDYEADEGFTFSVYKIANRH